VNLTYLLQIRTVTVESRRFNGCYSQIRKYGDYLCDRGYNAIRHESVDLLVDAFQRSWEPRKKIALERARMDELFCLREQVSDF
jgi:hypothetical protein